MRLEQIWAGILATIQNTHLSVDLDVSLSSSGYSSLAYKESRVLQSCLNLSLYSSGKLALWG